MEVFIDERKFSGYDEVADDEQTKKSSKIKPKSSNDMTCVDISVF